MTFGNVTSIAAIPPPSAFVRAPAPSGTPKLRQMLASDAIAVRPIQPIPDEQQRRRTRDAESTAGSTAGSTAESSTAFFEDGVRRSGGLLGEEVRSRPTGPRPGEPPASGSFRPDAPPPPSPPPPPQAAASPSTGFLTQSIAQEAMGKGLHIEPWRAAIGAYRRAGAEPRESLVSNISV